MPDAPRASFRSLTYVVAADVQLATPDSLTRARSAARHPVAAPGIPCPDRRQRTRPARTPAWCRDGQATRWRWRSLGGPIRRTGRDVGLRRSPRGFGYRCTGHRSVDDAPRIALSAIPAPSSSDVGAWPPAIGSRPASSRHGSCGRARIVRSRAIRGRAARRGRASSQPGGHRYASATPSTRCHGAGGVSGSQQRAHTDDGSDHDEVDDGVHAVRSARAGDCAEDLESTVATLFDRLDQLLAPHGWRGRRIPPASANSFVLTVAPSSEQSGLAPPMPEAEPETPTGAMWGCLAGTVGRIRQCHLSPAQHRPITQLEVDRHHA